MGSCRILHDAHMFCLSHLRFHLSKIIFSSININSTYTFLPSSKPVSMHPSSPLRSTVHFLHYIIFLLPLHHFRHLHRPTAIPVAITVAVAASVHIAVAIAAAAATPLASAGSIAPSPLPIAIAHATHHRCLPPLPHHHRSSTHTQTRRE